MLQLLAKPIFGQESNSIISKRKVSNYQITSKKSKTLIFEDEKLFGDNFY
jgi:hypothetical protein